MKVEICEIRKVYQSSMHVEGILLETSNPGGEPLLFIFGTVGDHRAVWDVEVAFDSLSVGLNYLSVSVDFGSKLWLPTAMRFTSLCLWNWIRTRFWWGVRSAYLLHIMGFLVLW